MPAERSLDAPGVERLERFLRSRRAELTQRVRHLVGAESAGREWGGGDEADRARATAQSEMDAAQLDRLSRQIAGMQDALERLGRRQYGWCDDCGTFIGFARLEALPFARRCRPCQSRAEADTDWLKPPA